jgi:membrane protein required for colicin V production
MNTIDVVILIFILFFTIRGLFRGFILELSTLIGLVIGYLAGITYLGFLSGLMQSIMPDAPVSVLNIISFSVIFIVINILLKIAANLVTKTLKFAMLGWLNRLLGAVFGLTKSILILSILVFLISLIPWSENLLTNAEAGDSVLFPLLRLLGPELYEQVQIIIGLL